LNTKNRGDTAKRHGDYRREKARLMGFMRRHGISHLMPGRYKSVYRYWLFGFIPFMKKIVGDTKVAWRLFGVPVFRAAASPAAVPARKYVAPGKVPGRPKVSVVIPVYNVEKYLAQCLESVVSQTYKNLEVIIVDDGSSDGSAKICKNYARGDKRIRIFRQKNAGQSVARNAGLALASGEFVHFLDSDDYISLDYYERMLAGIGRADMAAAGFYSEKKPSDSIRYDRPRVAVSILDKLSATDVPSQAMVWKFLFRRDFLIENDLRFPEGRINEDTVFSTAAVFFANRIAIVPLASYFYRMTPDSSLNNRSCAWLAKRREDYAVAKRALDAFAARHGISGYVEAVQGGVRSAKSFGPFGIPLVKKISYGHRVVYSLFGLIPLVKVK
jgi:glycosyltransferase involved in cell wall biosynthesis